MNYKLAIYSALFTTALFGGFSLIFYFGDWGRLAFVAFIGFFVGIMMAPEIEPKEFKFGWLLQISAGMVAGILAGLFFKLNLDIIVCCSILGGFIGWTAPKWIKHIDIP
jgi:uncharacterized membrane protein YeaQ/YmgE (transglycosylase-associated protein family)